MVASESPRPARAVRRCLTAAAESTGTTEQPTTVEWNTGETSDITVNVVGVSTGGGAEAFEFLGSVNAGKFAGDTVQMLNTFVSLDLLACLTPQGMTHRSGTTVLTLLDL